MNHYQYKAPDVIHHRTNLVPYESTVYQKSTNSLPGRPGLLGLPHQQQSSSASCVLGLCEVSTEIDRSNDAYSGVSSRWSEVPRLRFATDQQCRKNLQILL